MASSCTVIPLGDRASVLALRVFLAPLSDAS